MIYAIIVAAGSGLRMQSSRRKQFMDLGGRPILAHTLRAFDRSGLVDRLILVVPEDEFDFCRDEIIAAADLVSEIRLVSGGLRRQDSVQKGLASISGDDGIVLIHDGVRPLVNNRLIEDCIKGALKRGACIPALLPVDTLKQVDDELVIAATVPRDRLRMAQTPQAFQLPIIREAHRQAELNKWDVTDDASMVELSGGKVHVIPGLRENIKITTPEDLALAEFYLRRSDQG